MAVPGEPASVSSERMVNSSTLDDKHCVPTKPPSYMKVYVSFGGYAAGSNGKLTSVMAPSKVYHVPLGFGVPSIIPRKSSKSNMGPSLQMVVKVCSPGSNGGSTLMNTVSVVSGQGGLME